MENLIIFEMFYGIMALIIFLCLPLVLAIWSKVGFWKIGVTIKSYLKVVFSK